MHVKQIRSVGWPNEVRFENRLSMISVRLHATSYHRQSNQCLWSKRMWNLQWKCCFL